LPIASASGPAPTVAVTIDDWDELEGSLGKPIPSELRNELIGPTNNFLSFAIFELTAEPLEGAKVRIRKLSDSANAFWHGLIAKDQGDATFYGEHLVACRCSGRLRAGHGPWGLPAVPQRAGAELQAQDRQGE
jgi:hypothetical protein